MSGDYEAFLASKHICAPRVGVDCGEDDIHPTLYDFQRDLVRWALRTGRCAIFADCGLGKTLMQLEWARIVGGRCLIVAPLTVSHQTITEGEKIGVPVRYVAEPATMGDGVNITNYERIRKFVGIDLDSIVLDESSILKSMDGKTRGLLLESFTDIPWRLCCTATPCPNDIAEIANHSQFLGVMTRANMLASFFVHDQDGWRLRGHARDPFFRWLASWAMALKSPADLGYDGSLFALPPLDIIDEIVETDWLPPGRLFPGALEGIQGRIAVRKRSIDDRVARAVDLASGAVGQVIVWCGLNDEASRAAAALNGQCVEIKGADSPEKKRDALSRFLSGEHRVLVTKPKIAGFGMNFQNAATMIFVGLSDSYEAYYQCIRRSWRFGQVNPVRVHVVVTDHETEIVDNGRRKEREATALTAEIVSAAAEYEKAELMKADQKTEELEPIKYSGDQWQLIRGDCVEECGSIGDEEVDLSVFSPPFLSLYTYTPSNRDMGNSADPSQFMEHMTFLVDELLRVTKPGRICAVHCAQVATTLSTHGVIGLRDFRGMLIAGFVDRGWVYHGEVTIDKDPQAQAIRTHAKGLLFVQLKKDGAWMRPGFADYIVAFRKPGDNAVPVLPDITNDQWIEWARPVWYGIRESDTLNVREARCDDDDRHICALQLETIERCIRLWSNPGELVFSPFAGIGSEGHVALTHGRRFVGIELKDRYAEVAARNLARAESHISQPTLFKRPALARVDSAHDHSVHCSHE